MTKREMKDLTLPIVHLNGSGEANLQEWYQEMVEAVRAARLALCSHSPHGRDYYLNEGSFEVARREHEDRIEALSQIEKELSYIWMHVYKNGRKRS